MTAKPIDFSGGRLTGPSRPPKGDQFIDNSVDLTLKPMPRPTEVSEPFWTACRRHELIVQRCARCQRFAVLPSVECKFCSARALEWMQSEGRGTVYSYSVVHRAPLPAFEEDVPYVVAVIRLAEGYEMLSNVVNCEPVDVFCGMPVEVIFDDVTPTMSLPKFQPC